MSVLSAKIQEFKNWYIINQRTIITSLIIFLVGICLVDFSSIVYVAGFLFDMISAIYNYIIDGLFWVWENILDNQTVGAVAGAASAFFLMIERDKLENKKKEGKNLIKIKEELKMYRIQIQEDIKQANVQLLNIDKERTIRWNMISPFVYLNYIDDGSLLEISDGDLRNLLFGLKRNSDVNNVNMEHLNGYVTNADMRVEENCLVLGEKVTEIDAVKRQLELTKKQLITARDAADFILEYIDRSYKV